MNYRKYECNLETYYLKALKGSELANVSVDSLVLSPSGIKTFNGLSVLSTTHTFTSTNLPPLAGSECAGEMTFYMNNSPYVSVNMAIIAKSANTILQTLLYQKVGNFTTTTLTFSGNTITLTCSPAATVTWVFRGI